MQDELEERVLFIERGRQGTPNTPCVGGTGRETIPPAQQSRYGAPIGPIFFAFSTEVQHQHEFGVPARTEHMVWVMPVRRRNAGFSQAVFFRGVPTGTTCSPKELRLSFTGWPRYQQRYCLSASTISQFERSVCYSNHLMRKISPGQRCVRHIYLLLRKTGRVGHLQITYCVNSWLLAIGSMRTAPIPREGFDWTIFWTSQTSPGMAVNVLVECTRMYALYIRLVFPLWPGVRLNLVLFGWEAMWRKHSSGYFAKLREGRYVLSPLSC